MRLKEVKNRHGDTVEVNLDAMNSLIKNDYEWEFYFGGFFVPMDADEGKKLLDEVMKTEEGETNAKPEPKPENIQIMANYNVLDKKDVRLQILNADFLDDKSKLNLLVLFGV